MIEDNATRAKIHIRAIADAMRRNIDPHVDAELTVNFVSGMLAGFAGSLRILDGATAEDTLQHVTEGLTAAIDRAHLDDGASPTSSGRCGNDPRVVLSPGDQAAVDDFRAYLRSHGAATAKALARARLELETYATNGVQMVNVHQVLDLLKPAADGPKES